MVRTYLEICKGCKEMFKYTFVKKHKKFCSEKCEQDYFNGLRPKENYPTYACPCGKHKVQLDFKPIHNTAKWELFLKKYKCNYE